MTIEVIEYGSRMPLKLMKLRAIGVLFWEQDGYGPTGNWNDALCNAWQAPLDGWQESFPACHGGRKSMLQNVNAAGIADLFGGSAKWISTQASTPQARAPTDRSVRDECAIRMSGLYIGWNEPV
jgi:hypothetical protein